MNYAFHLNLIASGRNKVDIISRLYEGYFYIKICEASDILDCESLELLVINTYCIVICVYYLLTCLTASKISI